MRVIKFFILALGLFCVPTALLAIDLNNCVKMALSNSPAIRAYNEKILVALATNEKDRRSLYPQLSLAGEEGYARYLAESGLKNGVTGSAGFEFYWDMPKVLAGYPALSKIEIDKASVMLEQTRLEIERDVAKDYYKLYVLKGKKSDYGDAVEYFSSHIKDIEQLEDRGLDLKMDLIRADMQLKALATMNAAIETEIENTLMSINSATSGKFKLEDFKFEDISTVPIVEFSETQSSFSPLSIRLDELELSSAREAWRESVWNYAPTIAFGFRKALRPIDPATESNNTYISINWPIFDFGQQASQRKAMLREVEARENMLMENRRRMELSINQMRSELKSAAAVARAASAAMVDAKKIIETAREYYRQGKIKETDLLSVFSEYLDAKQRERDAISNYLEKMVDLKYLMAGSLK